jgi:hypothetical protein
MTGSGPRVPVDSSSFYDDDSSARPVRLELPPLPTSLLAVLMWLADLLELALAHRAACSSSIPSSSSTLRVFSGRSGGCVACCYSSLASS